jgi:hypothetical protein
MKLHLAVAVAAAGSLSSGAAWSQPAPISREKALSAPVQELAQAALADIAPSLFEVERPTFHGLGNEALSGLRFATAAESAGEPGMCKATIVSIDPRRESASMETSKVYKVVGPLKAIPGMWNDAYKAELAGNCAKAGRVLPKEDSDFGYPGFFRTAGPIRHIWLAARSLELAVAKAKSGGAVACKSGPKMDPDTLSELAADDPDLLEYKENQEACSHPAQVVAGLSLGALIQVDVEQCPGGAKGLCVSGFFLRTAHYNRQVIWTLSLRFDAPKEFSADPENLDRLTLEPTFAVYD